MKEGRVFSSVLITGINGSGGSYLAEYIAENHPNVEIFGVARWHSTSNKDNLGALANRPIVLECDLLDFGSIARILNDVNPDAIFHLASHANVRASFDTPLTVLNNNIMGTANLFEAIRLLRLDPVVQFCSSSEVYGQVDPAEVPITEECLMRPSSPYAVSKATQEHLAYTYWRCYEMKIIRTRMFAYFNPRRTDLFATSFAKQIALIEKGKRKELLHGNLDSLRTMIDVRDAMRSYWVAASLCAPGEAYNIGGPKTIRVGDLLDMLKRLATIEVPSKVDPKLLRPADVTLQIPNIDKFVRTTDWEPEFSFDESLRHLLDYWRNRV